MIPGLILIIYGLVKRETTRYWWHALVGVGAAVAIGTLGAAVSPQNVYPWNGLGWIAAVLIAHRGSRVTFTGKPKSTPKHAGAALANSAATVAPVTDSALTAAPTTTPAESKPTRSSTAAIAAALAGIIAFVLAQEAVTSAVRGGFAGFRASKTDVVPDEFGLNEDERRRAEPIFRPAIDVLSANEKLLRELNAQPGNEANTSQLLSAFGIRLLSDSDLDRLAAIKLKMMEIDGQLCVALYNGNAQPAHLVRTLLRLKDDDIVAWGTINAKAMQLEYTRLGSLEALGKEVRFNKLEHPDFLAGFTEIVGPLGRERAIEVAKVLEAEAPSAADACAVNILLHRGAQGVAPELRARFLRVLLGI